MTYLLSFCLFFKPYSVSFNHGFILFSFLDGCLSPFSTQDFILSNCKDSLAHQPAINLLNPMCHQLGNSPSWVYIKLEAWSPFLLLYHCNKENYTSNQPLIHFSNSNHFFLFWISNQWRHHLHTHSIIHLREG